MKAKLGISLLVMIGFSLMAFAGCAGKQVQEVKEPAWVAKGSGAFEGDMGKVFYGVGPCSPTKGSNKAFSRQIADNRARAEVAKVFKTYSASLMKDYQSQTTSGEQGNYEAFTEGVIKTFSAATLSGVEIVDHWTDPNDGTIYALARLDLNAFKDSLAKMETLDKQVKDYIQKNAERAFDDLAQEEAKGN